MNWPKMRRSTVPRRRSQVDADACHDAPLERHDGSDYAPAMAPRPRRAEATARCQHAAPTSMAMQKECRRFARRSSVPGGHDDRATDPSAVARFLTAPLRATGAAAWPRSGARASRKATITYWNGLTGADGKVMDELIDRFTKETGIKIEQQRIPWADLYAKLQVSVPAGEGPDLALIHTVEVPHFASDGVLEAIDDATVGGKGFRGEDYLPATWQGGTFQGKRYSLPLDVPQHVLYLNVKMMKDAGLVGADGKPKVPASRDELVTMAKKMTKDDALRLRHRHRRSRQVHLGLPQPALAERRQHLRDRPQARGAWPSRPRWRWPSSGPGSTPAQDRAAGERELSRRVHRRQARHVDRRLVELHRAARSQGRLRRRAACRASSSSPSCGRCRTSTPSRR